MLQLVFDRIETRCTHGEVTVDVADVESGVVVWSIANDSSEPAAVESIAIVWRVVDAALPLRMFRHGYQSWSPCGTAVLGVDADPSRASGAIATVVDMHNADPTIAEPGELRSEFVTVIADASGGPVIVAGFTAGIEHDGTFRLRQRDRALELWAEAHLGGAVVAPDDGRQLHSVTVTTTDDWLEALDDWATVVASTSGARTRAPYQVGWCSWYHYFERVTEAAIVANLARADDWPFDVFQLDDGYQSAIGDWLTTTDSFPSDLGVLADRIRGAGRTPGIWLAPFFVAPHSRVAIEHPDWIARHASGRPLVGSVNEHWGGVVLVLDTTQPEVQDHIEAVARGLVDAGYRYLKLDFTYAPALAGTYSDSSYTPAQRVRAGYDAVRFSSGDDAFLLGCGAPLAPCVGVVDGMRIGPDVAPWWAVPSGYETLPGYAESAPATVNAWRNTLARAFLHRKLWLNDPDCVMLRAAATDLSHEQASTWALAVGMSGGMALVSDDLALLDDSARQQFDDVLSLGREVDAIARDDGVPPRCTDLLDGSTPHRLEAVGQELVGDPEAGTASLQPRLL